MNNSNSLSLNISMWQSPKYEKLMHMIGSHNVTHSVWKNTVDFQSAMELVHLFHHKNLLWDTGNLCDFHQALSLKNGHLYLNVFLLDCSAYKCGDRSPKVTTVSGKKGWSSKCLSCQALMISIILNRRSIFWRYALHSALFAQAQLL